MLTSADIKGPNKSMFSLAKDQEDEKLLDTNIVPSLGPQSSIQKR